MDKKQLFIDRLSTNQLKNTNIIDWVSANRLRSITSAEFADLLERVFRSYCNKNIWDIGNPEEYNTLRKELTANKDFKKADKKSYKLFVAGAKLYGKFLATVEPEQNETAEVLPSIPATVTKPTPIILTTVAKQAPTIPQTVPDQAQVQAQVQAPVVKKPMEYLQEKNAIKAFFGNETQSDVFYKLFLYAKKSNPSLELDVRSVIVGVKVDGERLRFYSDKWGNMKFVGIKKTANLGKSYIANLYRDIDEVNLFFEGYQDKYLITDDEPAGYVYHSYFGFGKIVERSDKLMRVKFDNVDDEKTIQIGHHTCTEISAEEYESKKHQVGDKKKIEDKTPTDKTPTDEQPTDEQPAFKKIKWDKYETALLIEAFWKIENKEGTRKDILEALSKTLRQKAVNQGLKIDDIFRNYSGVSSQLDHLIPLFFPERSSLSKTKIFDEIADLYKTDREAYNKLLAEAHELAGDDIKTEPTANAICKIDFENFDKQTDLHFTQPKSVVYCGFRKADFVGWTDCYRYIMRCLYRDHPYVFIAGTKDSTFPLLANKPQLLHNPRRVADRIFVEESRNATDLVEYIRTMLDKCDVNYGNVSIEYEKKDYKSASTAQYSKPAYALEMDETDFYTYLKEDYEKRHKKDGKAYQASKQAQDWIDSIREIGGLLSVNVFRITAKAEMQRILTAISNLPVNEYKRIQYSYAIRIYYRFLTSQNTANAEKETTKAEEPSAEKEATKVEETETPSEKEETPSEKKKHRAKKKKHRAKKKKRRAKKKHQAKKNRRAKKRSFRRLNRPSPKSPMFPIILLSFSRSFRKAMHLQTP